ncbi:MAG TPA: hypothetical protein CFH84_06130 [Sulfurimonas sp. UBA12504]|nr:MAG: hypothetical protein A2019_04725 [Sulfurimonas sp. GWF2_37_8]DAB30050.1 MAG TPA: hypothetical protein CFH84_06130 [Sulfurimonas sp. UBA12504]
MKWCNLFCILSLLFVGCGDGGSSSSSDVGDNQIVKTGIFVDSPVQGLYYKTTTKDGFTNDKGEYQYIEGETVEFKFGDLSLGTVVAQTLVTPYSMETNNANIKAINIAVLFQSLDADRDGDMILDIRKLQNHKFIGISLDENETIIINKIKQLLDVNDSIGDPHNREVVPYLNAKTTMDDFINNYPNVGNDPKRNEQWHIDKLGLDTIEGKRINQTYIQVVDDGFDSNHEDLRENYDANRSWNPKTNPPQHDPTSIRLEYNHGTQVAGIIGARGFNGIGIRGVAPYSKLVGYTFLREDINGAVYGSLIDSGLEQAWFSGDGANDILVSNNSWGSPIYAYDYDYDQILQLGTTYLRDGKGRIYVMGAGNSRVPQVAFNDYHNTSNPRMVVGNSNLSHIANNQYAIAVGALNYDDTVARYSSAGSNLLVSAYAQGNGTSNIVTTDKNNQYSIGFNGTSAAAPQVSGIIGLVLEACPNLTYRDVKYLIATTSKKIDVTNPTWVKNSANLWHSIDYGYGVIDAKKMLESCKNHTTLSPLKEINATINIPWNSEDTNLTFANSSSGKSFDFNITANDITKTEWVGFTLNNFYHWRPGDLEITLTSPSGTKTELLQTGNALDEEDAMQFEIDGPYEIRESTVSRRLSSQAFYDENPYGIWKVTISDKVDNGKDGRYLSDLKLQIIGH